MAREDTQFRDTGHPKPDANRDPISGEPGAHPVGVGLGTATAGAVAGAAAGLVGGPVGAAVGAVVGGVAGGLAGKGMAEAFDPTTEDAYWRENYAHQPYYDPATSYDVIRPAYRHGWESRSKYADRSFDQVERDLRNDWESSTNHPSLPWEKAKHATRDAWHRVESAPAGTTRKR